MSARHVNALRSARADVLKDINMDELFLSELLSNDIITSPMKEEIDVSNG